MSRRMPMEVLEVDNNPLFINSVLEALFSLLDVENLEKCRFVCTVWKTEAFRALRKCACVNLTTNLRQQMFLKSEITGNFKMFSFKVSKWNSNVARTLSRLEPSSLEVGIDLILNNDDSESSFKCFEHLLTTHATSITRLNVNLDCNKSSNIVIPENMLHLKLPHLKELFVSAGRTNEISWSHNLWLSLFRNSPELNVFDLRNVVGDELWTGITSSTNYMNLTELRYVNDRKTAILGMHQQLWQNRFPTNLSRLCIPFQDSDSRLIAQILGAVAATLEVLEFHTQDETALSPIEFPVMHRLTTLDAGNSQFSFPTIVPEKFPKLVEIKATYWDWVYTREDLPDVHYYWRTCNPHPTITDIQLRFPDWTAIDFQYQKLENFTDFSEVLHSKFPAACNFTFHAVSLCNDVREGLEKFTEVFEFTFKLFKIESYCTHQINDASPYEINATAQSNRHRELEVLDLCPKAWPAIWSTRPHLLSTIRYEWLPSLLYFDKLRVLKLLWGKRIFSSLNLSDRNVLPNLIHLEFVGNLCIDRFERAAVRKSRPQLNIVQHKQCFCEAEDWWYMNDSNSDKVFQNLFSCESNSVTSFIKKIVFHNLLGTLG